ncbi:hypothetical protein HGRIS_010844 [Hohenbuehelia grisea]|uniref:Uncharacterized protein n=1 Tax=Hohenbuehelia grisea TaxID=104357 RepID=A0ABR3IY18_9AGAR
MKSLTLLLSLLLFCTVYASAVVAVAAADPADQDDGPGDDAQPGGGEDADFSERLARRPHKGEFGEQAEGPKNVRICYYNKFLRASFGNDPNVVKMDADSIYRHNWNIMSLKRRAIKPLIAAVTNGAAARARHNQQPAWWIPMYEAGICLLQERLDAENKFLYKLIPHPKKEAEPVYYRVDPIFPAVLSRGHIAAFRKEIKANEAAIHRALSSKGGLHPWMADGYRMRNKQLQQIIHHGPGAW